MEYLQTLLENSNISIISALLLGLLTAVSPCPLTTNIVAAGYIGKDIDSKRNTFINGICYALGQIISYAGLGCVVILLLRQGASIYGIQKIIGKYGDILVGPVFIILGILMLGVININFPQININGKKLKNRNTWGALFLGILLANAFCPTTAIFYFGILMPMSAATPGGYLLPVIYAVAAALPVILFAWILAYCMARLGKVYHLTQIFEKWFRRIVAILFIFVGVYYVVMFMLVK